MAFARFKRMIFFHLFLWIKLVISNTLDYSRRNLIEVPPVHTNVTISTLNLRYNEIEELSRRSFQNYHDLKSINLHSNKLWIIHDGTFDDITTLEVLILRINRLIKLPTDFGPSTSVLQKLDLWKGVDSPGIFSRGYFSDFISLEHIDVSGRKIGNQNDSFYPPNVKSLKMMKAGMDIFPPLSILSPAITRLSLQAQNIRTIPQDAIENLYLMEEFILATNQIINFPNFSHCTYLWELSMRRNKISFVPRQHIVGMDSIKIFRLEDNLLTNMTDISNLSTLEEFHIGQNLISAIPEDCIAGLPNMKTFDCHNNFLAFLPNISKFFPKIEILNVHGNYLKTLPDLHYQSSLKILTIAENPYVCDRSLCWLRMLPWMRPSETMLQDSPTCDQPIVLNVLRFHPTDMKCYMGKPFLPYTCILWDHSLLLHIIGEKSII